MSCLHRFLATAGLLGLATSICSSAANAQATSRVELLFQGAASAIDAAVSPNGAAVAYRSLDRISVMDITTRNIIDVASGTGLGDFLWRPESSSLYHVRIGATGGATIRQVSRFGGAGSTIAASAESDQMTLDDVDTSYLYGTRFVTSTATYHAFRVNLQGPPVLQDILSSQDRLSDLRVDPSGQYLLVRRAAAFPFAPVSFERIDSDGSNLIPISAGPVGTFAESPDWLDVGDTMIFAGVDPVTGSLQALRLNRTQQVLERMTSRGSHQRISVSNQRQVLTCESFDGIGGNGPVVMATVGGGVTFAGIGVGYQYTSPPTIDDAGTVVVWSAFDIGQVGNANIYMSRVADAMLIYPRAELNAVVTFDLPVPTGQVGAILIAGGVTPTPLTLPNVDYTFHLDASFSFFAAGTGFGGRLMTTLPIPPIPILQGLRIFSQGVTIDDPNQRAAFGRLAFFEIY